MTRTSVSEWLLSPGSPTVAVCCTECGELTHGPHWRFWDGAVATITWCAECVERVLSGVAS